MNQLELAELIDKTGHPYQTRNPTYGSIFPPAEDKTAVWHVGIGFEIIPLLAIPPDGRPVLNPGNLTAEQVGVGYRLVVAEDSCNQPHEMWNGTEWIEGCQVNTDFDELSNTYRLPLSIPWPEKAAKSCDDCSPEFGCFDKSEPCRKKTVMRAMSPKSQRKIVQICTLSATGLLDNGTLYALADDGTLWFRKCEPGTLWHLLPNIPQPEEDEK